MPDMPSGEHAIDGIELLAQSYGEVIRLGIEAPKRLREILSQVPIELWDQILERKTRFLSEVVENPDHAVIGAFDSPETEHEVVIGALVKHRDAAESLDIGVRRNFTAERLKSLMEDSAYNDFYEMCNRYDHMLHTKGVTSEEAKERIGHSEELLEHASWIKKLRRPPGSSAERIIVDREPTDEMITTYALDGAFSDIVEKYAVEHPEFKNTLLQTLELFASDTEEKLDPRAARWMLANLLPVDKTKHN